VLLLLLFLLLSAAIKTIAATEAIETFYIVASASTEAIEATVAIERRSTSFCI